MASFVKIAVEGINRLMNKFLKRKTESKHKDDCQYTVGYSAPYAIFVHENLEANHPHGQAKFLEQPAREMRGALARTIEGNAKKGIGLRAATADAALELFKESQKLVPVDTGALKVSGFVKDDKDKLLAGKNLTPAEV